MTIKALGANAQLKGRNDIVIPNHEVPDGSMDRKISVSAYRKTSQEGIHHWTILRDLDLSVMPRYLNPNKERLKSKGVSSVQKRVMNLKEVVPNITNESLVETMIDKFSEIIRKPAYIDETEAENLKSIESFARIKEHYEDMKGWTLGHLYEFTHKDDANFKLC